MIGKRVEVVKNDSGTRVGGGAANEEEGGEGEKRK